MLYLKILILVETLLIFGLAWFRNPDLFSPVKFYLVFSIFFYLAIYFQDVRGETLFCYLVLIQSIAVCAFLEKRVERKVIVVCKKDAEIINWIVWLLTIPPVVAMLYYVSDAGGVSEYFGVLGRRVETWKGQGAITVLLNTLPVLNLIYFGSVVSTRKTNRKQIILYGLHFIIFVTIGLLTASRSYVGISILGMCVVWAYLVRVPRLMHLFVVALVLVLFAGFMGAVRNNYQEGVTVDSVAQMLADAKFETAQMGYGVDPLEVIFESPERVHKWGGTYLTLVTNMVPRALWPEKPDTAGVIFTREYTPDQTGLSYFATGAVTEAIMNFGKPFGVLFGLTFNFLLFVYGSILYNRHICSDGGGGGDQSVGLFFVVGFYYVVLSISKVSYGEFTDVFQTLLFFNLAPLALVWVGLRFGRMINVASA